MTVSVFVTSPDTHSERKFDLHMTIGQLKTKLEPVTGIPSSSQKLVLCRTEDGQVVRELDDDKRPLGYFSVADWMTIQVKDTNPAASVLGQYSDVSQVEKFELSDEQYAQRQDSLLKFKQMNKLGRFQPPSQDQPPASSQPSKPISVGARCQVEAGDEGLQKRGTVRFVGPTHFGKEGGVWIGVEYDEPLGKNDGSVQGQQYFTCALNHGTFVRPDRVMTGDFPPVDLFDGDEEI